MCTHAWGHPDAPTRLSRHLHYSDCARIRSPSSPIQDEYGPSFVLPILALRQRHDAWQATVAVRPYQGKTVQIVLEALERRVDVGELFEEGHDADVRRLTPEDHQRLAAIAHRQTVPQDKLIERLLYLCFALEYAEGAEVWMDVHPLLIETEEFQRGFKQQGRIVRGSSR